MGRWFVPGMEMWRRQLRLEQGRGLEELAGRLRLAGLADSYCAQSAEGSVFLPTELMQRHHYTAALVLMMWRQKVQLEIGCWGLVASEAQWVLVFPQH